MILASEVLKDKKIILTGTTGFLGKLIFHRLLTEYEVEKVFLFVRGSSEEKVEKRFWDEIFIEPLFNESQKTLAKTKVQLVRADLSQPKFGMDKFSYTELAKNADLFIHSAASVKFDDSLGQAVTSNILGVKNVVDFCNSSDHCHLQHISTCYVAGKRVGNIPETLELPISSSEKKVPVLENGNLDYEKLLKTLNESLDLKITSLPKEEKIKKSEALAAKVSNQFGFFDIYTFTKWIAENLVRNECTKHKVAVLRPAIIESTFATPMPGWIEGIKVADPLILLHCNGKLPIFVGSTKTILDLIPADFVVNSSIRLAARLLTQKSKNFKVYHCGSSHTSPITISDMAIINQGMFKSASKNWFFTYWLVALILKSISITTGFTSQLLGLLRIKKLSKSLGKISRSIEKLFYLVKLYRGYVSNTFVYETTNLRELDEKVSLQNSTGNLPSIPQNFSWKNYFTKVHIPGLYKFALKSPMENLTSEFRKEL